MTPVAESVRLHPDCAPLSGLIGTWTGEGEGFYPTIDRFGYREETTFSHVGKPFLAYVQRSWRLDDETPAHSESGFWRPRPDGAIEVVLAHSFGGVEVLEGSRVGESIDLTSVAFVPTASAKDIRRVHRIYRSSSSLLEYEIAMEAVGQPLQGHLTARLTKS
ncbi:MAG: FABP family protein [Actinomycetota bacterium]